MNAVIERELIIPTPQQFGEAWKAFFLTVSSIVVLRSRKYGPARFEYLASAASDILCEGADSEEFERLLNEINENEYERVSLSILFEELLFISSRYQSAVTAIGKDIPNIVNSDDNFFSDEYGSADDGDVIDNIDVVKSSIQKILDKLPKWMRKAIEAILEALKLTRGIAA